MKTQHLEGSKWTAVIAKQRRRHFRVLSFSKKRQRVEMQCLIDRSICFVCFRELSNPGLWQPGWQQ